MFRKNWGGINKWEKEGKEGEQRQNQGRRDDEEEKKSKEVITASSNDEKSVKGGREDAHKWNNLISLTLHQYFDMYLLYA